MAEYKNIEAAFRDLATFEYVFCGDYDKRALTPERWDVVRRLMKSVYIKVLAHSLGRKGWMWKDYKKRSPVLHLGALAHYVKYGYCPAGGGTRCCD